MIRDFIYYWREYGFSWAWLYLQVGSGVIDSTLALIDNDCTDFKFDAYGDWVVCDCWELI